MPQVVPANPARIRALRGCGVERAGPKAEAAEKKRKADEDNDGDDMRTVRIVQIQLCANKS